MADELASAAPFSAGLVRGRLELAYESSDDDDGRAAKRARGARGGDYDEAPPPVRGGRGRVREDNLRPRGAGNTSRPASQHVDDVTKLGPGAPRRTQNSSRAPSKPVDDYQARPVVRKIAAPGDAPAGDEPRRAPAPAPRPVAARPAARPARPARPAR